VMPRRQVAFMLVFLLMAGAAVGYAAIPQNTIQHNHGITYPTINGTLGYWVGVNQIVSAARAASFVTLDTGQGANELYDMDQNVLTTSDVDFASVNFTGPTPLMLNGTIVEPDVLLYPESAYSYIIWTDGAGNYYAKNGTTGEVEFSGNEPGAVSNNVITALINGGIIKYLGGDYDFSVSLRPTDKIRITGEGKSTRFTTTIGIPIIYIPYTDPVDDVEIDHITIDLTNGVNLSKGIQLEAGNNFNIHDIEIVDRSVLTTGILQCLVIGRYNHASNLVSDVKIDNVVIEVEGRRKTFPLQIYWATNTKVVNSRFKGRDAAVPINAAFHPSVQLEGLTNFNFDKNVVEYGHHNGILFTDLPAASYSNGIHITNSFFNNNGDDAIDLNNGYNGVVDNCRFYNTEYEAVSLENGCYNWQISNIQTNTRRIYIKDSTLITVNNCIFKRDARGSTGIYAKNSTEITLTSNEVRGAYYGIDLDDCGVLTITGNIITPIGYRDKAIRLVDTIYVTMCSNDIYGEIGVAIEGIIESGISDYNLIENNNFAAPSFYAGYVVVTVGSHSFVENNLGYISSGEIRTASGTLTAGVANAIAFSWHNPEAQDILIRKVVVEVTTAGGTVGSHLDVGIADDAAGTNRGIEFFDDLLLNSVQINDSWLAGDGGQQTKWVFCQDTASAVDDWIVGQILDANAASLVGRYYIEYSGR